MTQDNTSAHAKGFGLHMAIGPPWFLPMPPMRALTPCIAKRCFHVSIIALAHALLLSGPPVADQAGPCMPYTEQTAMPMPLSRIEFPHACTAQLHRD